MIGAETILKLHCEIQNSESKNSILIWQPSRLDMNEHSNEITIYWSDAHDSTLWS